MDSSPRPIPWKPYLAVAIVCGVLAFLVSAREKHRAADDRQWSIACDHFREAYEAAKKEPSRSLKLEKLNEAIACFPDLNGPIHPEVEFAYVERASLYCLLGERDKAADDMDTAERLSPPQDRRFIATMRRNLRLE